MEIKTLALGLIRTNCYLVTSEKTALVIDPGFHSEKAEEFLIENSDKERIILITHAHFDHIGGALALREKTGVKIAVGSLENEYLSDMSVNLSDRFHAHLKPFSADILLEDGEEFTVGDLTVKTIFTAGHTKGGVCYLIDNTLFSGDTLFYESIGRTDFPTGDIKNLINSINMLIKELDGGITVYPGHGEATTLEHEKYHNPFLRGVGV